MTTDARLVRVQDLGTPNDCYYASSCVSRNLSAVDVSFEGSPQDRGGLWDLYQKASAFWKASSHYILHTVDLKGMNSIQKKRLERSFWGECLAVWGIDDIIDESCVRTLFNDNSFAGMARIRSEVTLSRLDPMLASDRFFLITGGATGIEFDPAVLHNLPYRAGYPAIPDRIEMWVSRGAWMCPYPMGRFDDVERSLLCVGFDEAVNGFMKCLDKAAYESIDNADE